MARSRNIKPGFFKNEDLAECSMEARLLFAGLWVLADRSGRLEDRPKRIKGELFAYDSVDVNELLAELVQWGFILRYRVGDDALIQVVNFAKHQNPHHREAGSVFPAPDGWVESPGLDGNEQGTDESKAQGRSEASPGQAQDRPVTSPIQAVLIPDSLNLIPDSLPLHDHPADGTASSAVVPYVDERKSKDPAPTSATWKAYSASYALRYGVEPVRNAKVNGQLANLLRRVSAEEAPLIAKFYVEHPDAFYGKKGHSVDMLLQDCEKLRTEWATDRHVGDTPPDDRRSRQLQTVALMTGAKPMPRRMGTARDFTDSDYREGIDADGHIIQN